MWELLIPFVASVTVTILLRRLDKSNLKLSKLKKYVSRVLEDFDRSARSREKEFKDASIDFEIQIRQGRALLQDLQEETEAIFGRLEALKNDRTVLADIQTELHSVIGSADTVRQQVDSIDEALSRLAAQKKDLTKTEHQLARVRREAGEMVGAFSQKIKHTSEDIFTALDEKIQSIENHYIEKENSLFEDNRQHLSGFVQNLENQFGDIKTDLTRSVDVILEETHKKVDQYGDKLEHMESSLVTARSQAESQLHQIREECLRYSTDSENQFSKISAQITRTEEDIASARENLYKELYNESQRIRAELSDFNLEAIAKKDEIVNAARREAEGIHKQLEEFQVRYLESENKLFKEADARNSELTAKLDAFEEDFGRIQGEHLEQLENRLHELAGNYDQQSTRQLKKTEGEIAKLRDELAAQLNTRYQEHTASVNEMIETVRIRWEKSDLEKEDRLKGLAESIDTMSEKLTAKNTEWKQLMQSTEKDLHSAVGTILTDHKAEMEELSSSLKDEARAQFNEFKAKSGQFRDTMLEEAEETLTRLENVARQMQKENDETAEKWQQDMKNYGEELLRRFSEESSTRVEHTENNLKIRLEGLQSRLDASMVNIEEKSRTTRESILTELESITAQTRNEFENAAVEKARILAELNDNTATLRMDLQELKGEVSEYQTVARVFTDADKMAKELDSRMSELKSNLQMVLHENDRVEEFMDKLDNLKDMRRELENEIKKVEKRQSIIDEFEGHISTVLNLSDEVHAKIKSIEGNRDRLDEIERGIQRFTEMFRSIDNRFEEMLEQRNMVEETTRRIQESQVKTDTVAQRTSELDGSLEKVNKKAGNLHKFLKEIETKSLILSGREEEMRAVEARFEEIEDLTVDLDARVQQIQSMAQRIEQMRGWMDKQRNDLKELGYQAESKIQKLSDFIESVENTSSLLTKEIRPPAGTTSSDSKKETILMLATNRNWSVDEISKYLNIDKSYVNTVLATANM